MLWFNACPHCSIGTVEARTDTDGRFLKCLSCSWTLYAQNYGRIDGGAPMKIASSRPAPATPRDGTSTRAA